MTKLENMYWKIRAIISLFKSKHYVLITIPKDDFAEFVVSDGTKFDSAYLIYGGIRRYFAVKLLRKIAAEYSEDEMVLLKAEFQAEYELFIKGKK